MEFVCFNTYLLLALLYGTLGIIIVIHHIEKVQKDKKMQKIFDNLKTSKIKKINLKGKKLNPNASISTLCLLRYPYP